ncbi:MAG TPA: ABC transporter ATP-binding protein [Caldilineaceae bacterium]|nr:ABC transporter ATP-binding protein [Caldilineaceae bacterium]
MTAVLQVENLLVHYHTHAGPVRAVEDVSFALHKGERFGLVGESGSGKSTMVLALLRMLKPPARIEAGRVLLGDTDLMQLSNSQMRAARFSQIALIPQGAMNSLNPVMRIKAQLADTIRYHNRDGNLSQAAIRAHIHGLLESVGLERSVAEMYPHELSGGMKQRVCIAMGISLQPQVILADEPTSALDVVVQRQVMETLGRVQEEIGASLILVGHDMGLMAQFVNTIGVMYAGKLVEVGPVDAIFDDPLHPYTQLLIASLPSLEGKGIFQGIPGITPSLLNPPPGCSFHPRCPQAMAHCRSQAPTLQEVQPGRWVSCLLHT